MESLFLLFISLLLSTMVGVQTKARDTERQTDIKAMHAQIEAYYAQNGKYPTLENINDPGWRGINMKGLDDEALVDPKNNSKEIISTPKDGSYSYEVYSSSNTTCDNVTSDCEQYTLTAILDDGQTYKKQNLN
ncbi:hypothetical protein KDA00_04560 [Candidatus Saccharibacteria bacterium]|nr:hypothetical protein [Candidatus Saccharibacteria bacterium]